MAKVTVPLMGGLGNQMFQLQAALTLFDGEIELIGNVGLPRFTGGVPDICQGSLPSRVYYRALKEKFLMRRIHSLVLRTFLNPSSTKLFRLLVIWFSSSIFSLYLMRPIRVIAATDLGYCDLSKIKKNTLLVGYFQSYRWENNEIVEILPNFSSQKFEELRVDSGSKSVCILHVRRTDYLAEECFGLLDATYYESALDVLSRQQQLDEIWLFSDDLPGALEILPEKYKSRFRIIDDADLNPMEVLYLMSLGSSYVIANSTFSWWAARISDSKAVIAPRPWFIGANDPNELLPIDWLRLDRYVKHKESDK